MSNNTEHITTAEIPAVTNESMGSVESIGSNLSGNSELSDLSDLSNGISIPSNSDELDELLNGLNTSGDEDLPQVDLSNPSETISEVSDNDIDFSFINEKNHYAMHKIIIGLIKENKLKFSNSQLLFDALNNYYNEFCQKLDTTTTNTKYFGFKFPSSKPTRINDSGITSYIARHYTDEEFNSMKECINSFLYYDVHRCNDNRDYQSLSNNIVLVRVREYPNLILTDTELDQLNDYNQFNKNANDTYHSINNPIIYDYSVFKSIKSNENINNKKIIRYEYLIIDRNICYKILSRSTADNNKSNFVKDLKYIYDLQHNTAHYPKSSNFRIFKHSVENIKKIRNVFEYLTFRPEHVLNTNNSEYSLLERSNINMRKNNSQTLYIYHIGQPYYDYNYNNSSTLKLCYDPMDNSNIESKVWITNYSFSDIKLNDILPLVFLIKSNINLKNTIYNKTSLCYVTTVNRCSYRTSNSKLLSNILDNYYKIYNNIKFVIDYSSLFAHYNNPSIRKSIYVSIFLKKNFINNIISRGYKISDVFFKTFGNKNVFKLVNPDVYINVLNTNDSKLSNRHFDNSFNSNLIYSFNKDDIPISSTLDESLESNININLFDYQKSNIMWMKNLENDITNSKLNYDFSVLKGICSLNNDNYYDVKYEDNHYMLEKTDNGRAYQVHHYDDIVKSLRGKISIPGGVICDEVGLGKTLSIVSHIVTQIEEDKGMRNEGILKYDINNLLILPGRLVSQWIFELNKYIKDISKFNIVKLGTLTDVKALDKKLAAGKIKLQEIDILIVCPNLLNNEKYEALIKEHRKKYTTSDDRYKFIDILSTKFNRIIVDEIHEITIPNQPYGDNQCNYLFAKANKSLRKKENKLLEIFNTRLQSNFKWCLTATPFNYGPFNLMGILNFLIDIYDKVKYQDSINNYGIVKGFYDQNQMCSIIKTHFKGIKKSDIRDVIDIPIFSEKIIRIPLSNIEKNIYNTNKSSYHTSDMNSIKRLFMICTNICIANLFNQADTKSKEIQITTLEDLNKMMIKKFTSSKNAVEKEKKKLVEGIPEFETKYKQFENINKILKEIIAFKEYRDFKNRYRYHLIDYLEIYKNAIKNENTETFGIKNEYMSQAKIIFCRIWHTMFQHLDKISQTSVDNYEDYLETIKIPSEDLYTINNSIDDILKNDEIACMNMALITTNSFSQSLTNNILKGFMTKIALIHYQINKDKFNTADSKIKSLDNDIKRYNNQIKIFSSNDFIKEKTNDPCMICFEEFDKVVVTKCRHVFCGDCHMIMSKNNTIAYACPECRGNVQPSQVIVTTMDKINQDDKEKQEDSKVEEVVIDKSNLSTEEILKIKEWRNQCINKYGSKMTYLIEYLQEILVNDENRVIIFSQYDAMLKLISKTLDEYKIKNVFCKGNVNQVSKRITNFKTDKSIRVIMLSSDKCNSGSNLTEANHIILVDVLNANKSTSKDIECQAIGRAVRLGQKKPVTVTRLITTDTIEEEYYNKNKYNIADIQ
jgi:SNF2 family DNA or RNA helicase